MRTTLPAKAGHPIFSPRRTAFWGALALVGLMVASSMAAATAAPTVGSQTQFGTVPQGPSYTPMTGAQLQNSPVIQAASTPLADNPTDRVISTVAPQSPTAFTIGFQLRNANDLANIIQAQETPGSPMYQHWLTVPQEEQMFGPSPVVVQNTINYYTSLGFTVNSQGPFSVSFTGKAADAEAAFHTTLSNVVNATSSTPQVINTIPLSVPEPLSGAIASINGYEGMQAHPTSSISPAVLAQGPVNSTAASEFSPISPSVETNSTNETEAYNYTNHAFFWFNYFDTQTEHETYYQVITPASLNWMYDAQKLINEGYNGNNSSGKQITIAIVMGGGLNPGDLKAYGQMVWNNPNALIDRITPVPVDRQFGLNGTETYTDDVSGEMQLDVEYSGTMAPGAHIEPVYALTLFTNMLDDDYAAIYNLKTLPNIISNSWGESEDSAGSLTGPNWQNDQTMNNYFMLLDARGSTILASTGDGGGIDFGSGVLSGSFPATDPYVLGVNGVRTTAVDSAGQLFPNPSTIGLAHMALSPYANEPLPGFEYYPIHVSQAAQLGYQSYWYVPISNTTLESAAPTASGGFGTSYWFNQSWWQHGFTVPNLGRSLGSGVAAEADFNQSIFFDGAFNIFWGGTSFACPSTAGMFADIEDYLEVHGHSAYLGDGNVPVFEVGNAWNNGNLTLNPFFDITNGTSYWGDHGVNEGWQWPPGQEFPRDPRGFIDYGNTTQGWNFPAGWGVINVYNFAVDLNFLESLPAQFATTSTLGGSVSAGPWDNMATNQTYYFHVNVTSAVAASNPQATVEFFPEASSYYPATVGSPQESILHPTLTPTGAGYIFSLSTGSSPLNVPGLIVFTLGNSTSKTVAFAYDWISWAVPSGGTLAVTVVNPEGGAWTGGSSTFGAGAGIFFPPIVADPQGFNGQNMVVVRVTLNGQGVYDAPVTANVASPYDLAFEGSRALNISQSYGQGNTPVSSTVSTSFTNQTGYAWVQTWNVIQPTTLFINATYGVQSASTTFDMLPPPNLKTVDAYGVDSKYSAFDWIQWVLNDTHQSLSETEQNLYAFNSVNQSGWYTMFFGYQGEEFPVTVNDYQGHNLSGIKVWFGNYDLGHYNKFYNYEASDGVLGIPNDTATENVTDGSGAAYITIPQNESLSDGNPVFGGDVGTFDGPAAFGAIAASIPGETNSTVHLSEPCQSEKPNSVVLATCIYNDSVWTNYTSTPILILPDPVTTWTQTPALTQKDFFGEGAQISFGAEVNLPGQDPWVSGPGTNYAPGQDHIVSITAFVDGQYAGETSPPPGNLYQIYNASANLTGSYGPGIHDLTVIVRTSAGQIFTSTHRFVIGNVAITNLNIQNTYTTIPYTLNWSLNIPVGQINNHTFSQSVEIQYITGGCSGLANPCPIVVNLTEKIHDGVQDYNQSINETMLNLKNFYSGAGFLPSGQYEITVWLNANHSGNVTTTIPTYFVFSDLSGSFTGPTSLQQVPLGNVTISYQYTGAYLENATLFVFATGVDPSPVYQAGIFVPGEGSTPRGGAVSWDASVIGPYRLVMDLGTPYTHLNITEWINVTLFGSTVYINQTKTAASMLSGLSTAQVGTILAVAAGILGFLVGLFAAPAFRGAPSSEGAVATGPKPWEEISAHGAAHRSECPVCHEQFETDYAMHNHQKMAHGIEE